MNLNPYQPPIATPQDPVLVDLHPPSRDQCPVCKNAIKRIELWSATARCSKCATELTLATKHDDKPGVGCLIAVSAMILNIVMSVIASLMYGIAMLNWLLLLLPIVVIYSMAVRWFDTYPYPKSHVSGGRIPAPPAEAVDAMQKGR